MNFTLKMRLAEMRTRIWKNYAAQIQWLTGYFCLGEPINYKWHKIWYEFQQASRIWRIGGNEWSLKTLTRTSCRKGAVSGHFDLAKTNSVYSAPRLNHYILHTIGRETFWSKSTTHDSTVPKKSNFLHEIAPMRCVQNWFAGLP